MCRKIVSVVCFALALSMTGSIATAGISYADPLGGWAYIYTGDQAAYDNTAPTTESLDGKWGHNDLAGGDSDAWDGSPIGSGNFGGVMSITEGNVTFLRIQDCGDPRDHAPNPADPSNRKLMFTHNLAQDGIDPAATILNSGVTLSFRARVATTGPLDDVKGDGGSPTGPWPAGGDGYGVHHEGKGNFGIRQNTGDAVISFCLVLAGDAHATKIPAGRAGLCMNNLNGTSPSATVDIEGNEAGTLNLLDIADPTQWHEFWIQIVADTSGGGTHKVTIWMDGNAGAPNGTFHVTAGNGNDEDYNYLEMGCGSTAQYGAFDADFFTYKPGLIPPVAANPNLARVVNPLPETTVGVGEATPLSWLPGQSAKFHDVYLGIDKANVSDAGISDTTGIYRGRQSAASYSPPQPLELGVTYYWRVDEVEANLTTIHKGDVWSFTVMPYVPVDDMETYGSADVPGQPGSRIWYVWNDGYGWTTPAPGNHGNGTGAIVDVNRATAHGGSQSLRIDYDNDGTFYNIYAELKHPYHSEVQRGWTSPQDWTRYDGKALSLWFRGYPAYFGSFVEAPAGTYAITAGGADIWGTSDQFHFAFKEVSGASSIVAKVLSVTNTHAWAKAGVMIRDSLDPDSTHAMVVVTPGSGVAMQYRSTTAGISETVTQAGIVAPQWVKLERTLGGLVRGYYSADGTTWTQLGSGVATITMNIPMYVGLALTSHNVGEKCVARFSDVSFPGTTVGPQWDHQDIGITSNVAEPMYVAISSGNGKTGVAYHDDPNATLISTWTEWNIDLKKFSDQGVSLSNVDKMFIGFGNKANPKSGGKGTVYFDDIRLYPPRCVLDKRTGLEADFTDDCLVNGADLEMMANDWLQGDRSRLGQLLTYWAFDEGSGTIARDTSGKGHDGVLSGPTWRSPGYGGAGACLSFNGLGNEVNDVDAGDYLNGLDAVTFSVWIKSNLTNTDRGFLICTNPDGTDNRDIRYDEAGSLSGRDDVIKCGITSTDGIHEIESAATIQTTDWQHVAMAWKSGEALRLYINGALDGSFTNQPIRGGTLVGYQKLLIGRGGKDTTAALGWDGLVDEVRIYDYALSQDQIKTVMNKGSLPSVELYSPLTSIANLYDAEPQNQKKVNFKDYAILADQWLKQVLWP